MHKVSHPAHGSLVTHADLIVVDGDPRKDFSLPAAPGQHMPLVVKRGAIAGRSAIKQRMDQTWRNETSTE
jgi:hypothetical protein